MKKKKTKRIVILKFQILIFNFFHILPATGTTSEPVLSVVQSQENTNQWIGITNRLHAAEVKYCVIPLANVTNAADWGNRAVLFLPNIETLTPVQAIALEEWISKGGQLIVSGPVGSLSAPGVRQLLRTIIGGYWGFSLSDAQNVKPSPPTMQEWANQNRLSGKVRGGVVIADNLTSQAAAVWDSKDNPAAVVVTDRSTFFGWRWGVDAASPQELDTAWLKAALDRHLKTSLVNKVQGGSQSCTKPVATASSKVGTQGGRQIGGVYSSAGKVMTAVAPQPRPVKSFTPEQRSDEAINQLEQAVRLDVQPNSTSPINPKEAIALQQELENLIGRVESANIAASIYNGNQQYAKVKQAEFASTKPVGTVINSKEQIAQAREILNNLPQWIAQKNYAQARQQWLMAKGNLWNLFPLDKKLAQPEIRGMWLDRGSIVRAGSEQRLAEIFDRMVLAGINTVFFETVNASYTIYPSQIAPQQNPLTLGWDPLASAVKLAHERGMELHAWVWTFAAGNQRHNELLHLDSNYLGPVLAAHPDWAGYDHRGQIVPVRQQKPFFDPANPQVRQYLLNLYDEIVTRYDVDGLQLDYIRYPFQDPKQGQTYGYGKAARRQFQQLTGVDPAQISPTNQDLWQKWTDFRTQQIDSFVAEVSRQLRQKRPRVILSVAVFPLPEQERIQKIQQHWEVWGKRGDVDLIVPMNYAQDTLSFERLGKSWIGSKQLGSSLLIPGIRLLSLPVVGTFDQIQLTRDLPVGGYALFAAENFSNDLYKVFHSTQGNIQNLHKEPIPHRQPFQTAAARYSALQQEWRLVVQNDQMRVPTKTLLDLTAQAEVLQKTLDQLATKPTASQWIMAKASLTRFQSLFRVWMRPHALLNPYQVKVWENRLATIERLLKYGERFEQWRRSE